GVLLQMSGQAVLRHLGVLDRVLARAAPIESLYARQTDGRTLIRTVYADYEPGCRAYGVHRGVLFGALYDLLRTQPADVRLGGGGLCSMYWGLPVREFAGLKARGLDALKAEILAFSPEAAEVLGCLHHFDQLILTSYRHVHLRRWYDETAVFIGDAAHAMSPHLGQGINLAMV